MIILILAIFLFETLKFLLKHIFEILITSFFEILEWLRKSFNLENKISKQQFCLCVQFSGFACCSFVWTLLFEFKSFRKFGLFRRFFALLVRKKYLRSRVECSCVPVPPISVGLFKAILFRYISCRQTTPCFYQFSVYAKVSKMRRRTTSLRFWLLGGESTRKRKAGRRVRMCVRLNGWLGAISRMKSRQHAVYSSVGTWCALCTPTSTWTFSSFASSWNVENG